MAIVDMLLEVREKKHSVITQQDWREKKVWHTTPTGQRNRIKIKYLDSELQLKYAPPWYKRMMAQQGATPPTTPSSKEPSKHSEKNVSTQPDGVGGGVGGAVEDVDKFVYDFYFGTTSKTDFNVVSADQIIEATPIASAANEFEEKNWFVAEVMNVPMAAVIEYKVSGEEWVPFEGTDEEKYNKLNFGGEIVWVKLNLYPFLKDIKFDLVLPEDEKLEKESIHMGILGLLKEKLIKTTLNENVPTSSLIDEVKKIVEAFSYEVVYMIISITGKGVFNVDTMRIIDRMHFKFIDDEGVEHDNGTARIINHNTSSPLTYYDEKGGAQHETVAMLQIPKGSEENALEVVNAALKEFKLSAKIEPHYRKAETVQGKPKFIPRTVQSRNPVQRLLQIQR